jgi:CRP-like cAMP-binding protein
MNLRVDLNSTSNRLLGFLSTADSELLASNLKPVPLELRQSLEIANQPIEKVYFPEDGIASVVGDSKTLGQIEVGIIGREGMTGLHVVLGSDRSPFETFVQVAGSALEIKAEQLRTAMNKSPTLRQILLRYVQVFMIQTSQTAISNAAALLTQRLARWLLMCADRLNSKQVPLTHEFLSIMLGVQRPGVTMAVNELEGRGLVEAHRGQISIVDRPALIKLTNGAYGMAEAEYRRRFEVKKS